MTSKSIYSEFKPTFLYIKQHTVTGKLYFGKTTRNPEKYLGSGKYWKLHIKKYGKKYVTNLWYCLFLDEKECKDFAIQFSTQNNIVNSKEWANLKQETLDGGWDYVNDSGLNGGLFHNNKINAKDRNNNSVGRIDKYDERFKTGELVPLCLGNKYPDQQGKATAFITLTGESLGKVDINDKRWKSGEICSPNKYRHINSLISKIKCPHCSLITDKAHLTRHIRTKHQ